MQRQNEKKLLNIIKLVPLLMLVFFSITTTTLMIQYNNKQLLKEIKYLKNNYINLQKEIIKKEVLKVHAMISYEYENLKHLITKEDILKKIESMKYDKDGYIFIIDYEGNFLINIEKSFIEKNQINLKDETGFMITKEIIKIAKEKEGYLSYIGLFGTHHNQSEKISYIKGFDACQWAIGYGFHPSDIEPKILKRIKELQELNNELVKKILLTNIILTFIFVIFFILFSKNIQNRFDNYQKKIRNKKEKNRQKDEIIFHQSKMATIGELLSIISHQWRQPLAQINAVTLDMYMDQKQDKLGEVELKRAILDIETTTQYLSNTIDDFSRFFVQETHKVDFSPNVAIQECLNILSPSLRHIEIKVNILRDVKINAYITLYQQVILTIITNSIDAFASQNIINSKIEIDIDKKDNKSYVSISDNANGIKSENIAKVFDLYFSTKNDKKVSGLGLYIAKKIIHKNMGGNIMLENKNDGVTFTISV
ncbi:MAG: two-component system NtrC family sensor kinase [Sulfurimonas sp.]|jgi:two-component system NtrC family sensor kinase